MLPVSGVYALYATFVQGNSCEVQVCAILPVARTHCGMNALGDGVIHAAHDDLAGLLLRNMGKENIERGAVVPDNQFLFGHNDLFLRPDIYWGWCNRNVGRAPDKQQKYEAPET